MPFPPVERMPGEGSYKSLTLRQLLSLKSGTKYTKSTKSWVNKSKRFHKSKAVMESADVHSASSSDCEQHSVGITGYCRQSKRCQLAQRGSRCVWESKTPFVFTDFSFPPIAEAEDTCLLGDMATQADSGTGKIHYFYVLYFILYIFQLKFQLYTISFKKTM